MPNFLSTSELFNDRVELVGYATLAGSAIMLVVYFAMIFFYSPVIQQSPAAKAALLLLFPLIFFIAWWIPKHKNTARFFLSCTFLGLGLLALIRVLDENLPWYGLLVGYTFWGYWVLSHPAAIAFFRPLKLFEINQQERSQGFYFFRAYFVFQAVYAFYLGMNILSQAEGDVLYNPGRAVGLLAWSLLLWGLLFLLRRGKNFARWSMLLVMAIAAAVQLPDTFSTHSYAAYWKALGNFFVLLAFALYLAFSRFGRECFQKPKPPVPGTAPNRPA